MKKSNLRGFGIFFTLIFMFLYFYVTLPAINIKSPEFNMFFIVSLFILCCFSIKEVKDLKNIRTLSMRFIPVIIMIVIILINILFGFVSGHFFNAKKYRNQIVMSESDFNADISELSFSQIPIVDKDTASRLGSRKIGEVVELVSQFEISNLYTQINYQNKPFRVTPLEYSSFYKWIINSRNGIPYYVSINMTTQDTQLTKLENGMKISTSSYFGNDLIRYARFKFPTKMFDEYAFEIDDKGNPFWIISTYKYDIMWNGGKNTDGIIMIDAVNGASKFYNVSDVPSWVDNVFPSRLIVTQINNYGKYGSGYFNSIMGQKGVLSTTDGYNSLAINDDIWIFTGLTSVARDESNVGFVLANKRTKETKYYPVNGAEEYSAMSSAEGKVQEKGYNATFPLLLNVANTPTYFISLKDNAGLVKLYAFVSVENYQVVGVGDTIQAARNDYFKQLQSLGGKIDYVGAKVTGNISDISTAIKDGNSLYYISIEGAETVYMVSIEANEMLPILKIGDNITINYLENESILKSVNEIIIN